MNDYDDSEDCSSTNSFRARSNTWPLNRPDLAVQNSFCIDETLPEIELEEDDLFTTNENWTTGLIDHDIMSWDPILNAQNHNNNNNNNSNNNNNNNNHHQQSNHLHNNIINQTNHLSQTSQQQQPHHQQQQQQQQIQATSSSIVTTNNHHNQVSTIHHHHHHQIPDASDTITQQHHNLTLPLPLPQTAQLEPLLSGDSPLTSITGAQVQQQQSQLTPQHHQTLNSSNHCLDPDDPNDYHIQQLHHLSLDNNHTSSEHQTNFVSPLSSVCIQNNATLTSASTQLSNDCYNNISTDHHLHQPLHQHHHQHHHLHQQQPHQHHLHHQQQQPQPQHHHLHHQQQQQQQQLHPLTSTGYELDQQSDIDLKSTQDINDHQHHHQLHHLTLSNLDHHSSQILSSSLDNGIGLGGHLEDLDFKGVDPSVILKNPLQLDEQQQQQEQKQQDNEAGDNINKQSSSTSSSKTKLNTPRRNAWGNMSYADLISQAINSTNDKRLTLSQIYDWMVQHVPYFKDKGDSNSSAGWKNSVRHNLSLHNRFKRLQNEGTGKSSWWTINPETNVGKCARRRAASMEASKYEKKRGRAKKRAEAVRQGLVSYPSLTNSSLNVSAVDLDQIQVQQQQQQPNDHFGPQLQQPQQHQPQQQQPQPQQQQSQQQPQQQSQQHQQPQPPPQHQQIPQLQSQPQQQPQQFHHNIIHECNRLYYNFELPTAL